MSARARTLAASALVALLAVAVHAGALPGPFVYDDVPGIVENPNLRSLRPLSRALGAPPGTGASGRPVEALTLAVDHALFGLDPRGFRLTNLVLHALAALTLLAAVRRGMQLAGRAPPALAIATATALLWAVHPLQGDALHQPIYRNETLAALFYFLTVWAALRALSTERPRRWWLAATVACALAMGSKEIAVSAPLAVLALDRLLVAGSFREALVRRRGAYLALASTWVVLALSLASGDRGVTVGFGHPATLSPWASLLTQAGALVHYAGLVLWPHPLVLDYDDWPVALHLADAWLPAAAVAGLFALTVASFARRRVAGTLGLAAFAILAPTSSFIPLAGALAAEHRMVLPLAPLLLLVVLLGARGLALLTPPRGRRAGVALTIVLTAALAARSSARSLDFRTAERIWSATVAARPNNARAWTSLGLARKQHGDAAGAEAAYRRALELRRGDPLASNNLAGILIGRGDLSGAERLLARALETAPERAAIRFGHANVLVALGEVPRALDEYRLTLASSPAFPPARNRLARILATHPDPSLRDGQEALRLARALIADTPDPSPVWLDTLAAALAETGDFAEAERTAARGAEAASAQGLDTLARGIEEHRREYAEGRPRRELPRSWR